MTPEQEALREKVAMAIAPMCRWEKLDPIEAQIEDMDDARHNADAAIAVVLNEAARVFEQQPDSFWSSPRVAYDLRSLIPQEEGK